MRHPFDGINRPTRRTWLGLMAAAGAYLGIGPAAEAAAPPGNRLVAEPDPNPPKPKPITTALREAGGVTTKAIGEEGAATRARGEAGGPIMTTLAIGEEGAKK